MSPLLCSIVAGELGSSWTMTASEVWRVGSALAPSMAVAVESVFDTGRFDIANGLDENRIEKPVRSSRTTSDIR